MPAMQRMWSKQVVFKNEKAKECIEKWAKEIVSSEAVFSDLPIFGVKLVRTLYNIKPDL